MINMKVEINDFKVFNVTGFYLPIVLPAFCMGHELFFIARNIRK